MPAINMSSIMSKVGAYSRSVSGKLRMKECIQKYAAEGKNRTAAGSNVMTEADMIEASGRMIQFIQQEAQMCDLPQSVLNHLYNLDVSDPIKMPDGTTMMYIYFSGNLHRDALENDEGYIGIDNVVALFNNGSPEDGHTPEYIYGYWNGHKPTGEALTGLRSTYEDKFAWVRSKRERAELHFIQNAIENFNSKYGNKYNVVAIEGDQYKPGYPWPSTK